MAALFSAPKTASVADVGATPAEDPKAAAEREAAAEEARKRANAGRPSTYLTALGDSNVNDQPSASRVLGGGF